MLPGSVPESSAASSRTSPVKKDTLARWRASAEAIGVTHYLHKGIEDIYGVAVRPVHREGETDPLQSLLDWNAVANTGGKQHTCVVRLDSRFSARWDAAQFFALLYVAVLVPVRTGFLIDLEPGSFSWFVELAVDVYFVADIFVNFRRSYVDGDGVYEMRPKQIARNYLQGWFSIDLVSCLPISYILLVLDADADEASPDLSANNNILKVLRLLRLAKLLRLAMLKRVIKRHEDEVEGLMGICKLIGCVVVVVYTCHLFGCFWYLVVSTWTSNGQSHRAVL